MPNLIKLKEIIQPGDILLSSVRNSLISETISAVTHSQWTHAILYIGNNQIVEANWDGVKVKSLDSYQNNKFMLGCFRAKLDLTEHEAETVIKRAKKMLGIDYGYLQLVWQAFLRLIRQHDNPRWSFNAGPGVICTEVICRAYLEVGIKLSNVNCHQVEPVDIAKSEALYRIF